ncbi:hypothetical protein BT69DRAFT_471964 [Atractiella rhizophila]|nr:hypothetical protein BT69DRAFT_471964 [Atractiella rhizophila]
MIRRRSVFLQQSQRPCLDRCGYTDSLSCSGNYPSLDYRLRTMDTPPEVHVPGQSRPISWSSARPIELSLLSSTSAHLNGGVSDSEPTTFSRLVSGGRFQNSRNRLLCRLVNGRSRAALNRLPLPVWSAKGVLCPPNRPLPYLVNMEGLKLHLDSDTFLLFATGIIFRSVRLVRRWLQTSIHLVRLFGPSAGSSSKEPTSFEIRSHNRLYPRISASS